MAEVYLAGPIEGCTEEERNDWRKEAKDFFMETFLIHSYFPEDEEIGDRANEHAIFYKDLFQIDQCKIVLANISHMNGRTFGTPFEMGYAYAKNKLTVVVAREDQLYHPFVTMGAAYFTDLKEALNFICCELRG